MRETEKKLIYSIRAMEEHDIPQVLELDREAFPTQWPYPTYSSYKQELRNRLAHYIVAFKPNEVHEKNNPARGIAQHNNNTFFSRLAHFFKLSKSAGTLPPPSQEIIIGAAGFWLMVGEVHIITIAVRNAYRRLGIGEKMLVRIIDDAVELKARMVTLEVRVSNTTAQELYKKYGFVTTGMRRKYYTDNGENALIMTVDNITSSSFRQKMQSLKESHSNIWEN